MTFDDLNLDNLLNKKNYSLLTVAEFDNPLVATNSQEVPSSDVVSGEMIGDFFITKGFIRSKDYVDGSSGWTINDDGSAQFSDVTVRGTIYASLGEIGGIEIGSDYLQSDNYVGGLLGKGFKLSSNGDAEFQNIKARGKISTSVFEKETISSVGGSLIVSESDILSLDMTSADNSTITTENVAFAVGTILRIKDGTDDEWLKVTAVSTYTHTVTRDLEGNYASGSNPVWTKGTAVVSMAETNKGFIEMNSSSTNSPYMKVYKRDSDTYNDIDTKVVIGNLKDKTGVEEYGLWIGSGAAYIAGYRLYEAVVDVNGDGDYSDIQSALDAGAKRIFVRSGTYNIAYNTALELSSGTVLIGENKKDTILLAASSTNKENIKIFGTEKTVAGTISVSSGSDSVSGTSTSFTSATTGDSIDINGVLYEIESITDDTTLVLTNIFRGRNVSGYATKIYTVKKDISILNFTIIMTGLGGVAIGDGVENLRIGECIFDSTIDSSSGEHINLKDCYSCIVYNNIFYRGQTGIELDGNCFNNIIKENTIGQAVTNGIRMDNFNGQVSYNKISNNNILNFSTYGIIVDGDRNIISGNTSSNGNGTGLSVATGANLNIISNNIINNNSTAQITDNGTGTVDDNNIIT